MDNTLTHYGILGMRWGVRKNKSSIRNHRNKKIAGSEYMPHQDHIDAHSAKPVSAMSNAELQKRINRVQMEKQYASLTKKKNRGQKAVKAFVATAGTLASVRGAYKTYKLVGDDALKSIGSWVISGIKY